MEWHSSSNIPLWSFDWPVSSVLVTKQEALVQKVPLLDVPGRQPSRHVVIPGQQGVLWQWQWCHSSCYKSLTFYHFEIKHTVLLQKNKAGNSFSFFPRPLQHVDCVILDDGGFLLMSNQDEYISLVSRK